MSKAVAVSAVAAAVLGLAFVSNPSPEKHRAEMKEAISQRSLLEGVLGIGSLTAFASTYRSLGVASYTTVNGHLVTIGAFGIVFLVS